MTSYIYAPQIALDGDTQEIAPAGSSGNVYASTDLTYSTPLAITDTGGVSLPSLTAGAKGFIPGFRVEDNKTAVWKSGAYTVDLFSYQSVIDDAEAAVTAAEAARDSAAASAALAASADGVPTGGNDNDVLTRSGGLVVWSPPTALSSVSWSTGIVGKPSTFPPDPHTHSIAQTGATVVGQAVMGAVDQTAARNAIAAAPNTNVSFPGFGTTSGTAAAGSHVHTASTLTFTPTGSVTATDVQAAIVQAASLGGGGTGGSAPAGTVVRVFYASGAYPVRPTGLPTGASVEFVGPVQPTIGGLYAISGLDSWLVQ